MEQGSSGLKASTLSLTNPGGRTFFLKHIEEENNDLVFFLFSYPIDIYVYNRVNHPIRHKNFLTVVMGHWPPRKV